jgi:hypothetical protein
VVDVDHEHGEGPVEPPRALEPLREDALEVAHVVEAGLRLDPRRLDETWDRERAIGQRERQRRQGNEAPVNLPERRPDRAERNEPSVDEDAVHPDGVQHPNAAREAEHDREHRVLGDDEGGDSHRGSENPGGVSGSADGVEACASEKRRADEVRDVEDRDVPARTRANGLGTKAMTIASV